MAQAGETLHDKINLQLVAFEKTFFWPKIREGTPLNLYELNSILMELNDIDVKIEDDDLVMIVLTFLPSSYDNFVSSLSVGEDFITL